MELTDLWDVARRTAEKLFALGMTTPLQLRDADPRFLRERFSVVLKRTVYELRGTPCIAFEDHPQSQKHRSLAFLRPAGPACDRDGRGGRDLHGMRGEEDASARAGDGKLGRVSRDQPVPARRSAALRQSGGAARHPKDHPQRRLCRNGGRATILRCASARFGCVVDRLPADRHRRPRWSYQAVSLQSGLFLAQSRLSCQGPRLLQYSARHAFATKQLDLVLNAHLIESVLKHVAHALGWRPNKPKWRKETGWTCGGSGVTCWAACARYSVNVRHQLQQVLAGLRSDERAQHVTGPGP
jgi:hypothetical protein